VATVEEARAAVQDYVLMKPAFIKIWVDDRGGTKQTLTPPLYRAIVDEAHRHNVPVGVHNVTGANAKELMRAGVEGWLHVPVRGGEAVDAELVAIVKERIAQNNRPTIWMTPGLITAWMNTQGGSRPAWLEDPLLRATYSAQDIEEHWGSPLAKLTREEVARARRGFELDARNAMTLRAAGIRIVNGTDTGQTRFWIGYFSHLDLESLVAMGMTAIGMVGDCYSQNQKTMDDYFAALDAGHLPVMRGVTLDADDKLRRTIITQLICHFALDMTVVEHKHGIRFADYFATELADLKVMQQDGLLDLDEASIRVLPAGKLLIRNICMVFDRYLRTKQEKRYSKVI